MVAEAETKIEKYANPATAFLGSFLRDDYSPVVGLIAQDVDFAAIDWKAKKIMNLPAAAMAQRLDDGLRDREW